MQIDMYMYTAVVSEPDSKFRISNSHTRTPAQMKLLEQALGQLSAIVHFRVSNQPMTTERSSYCTPKLSILGSIF